MTEYRRQDGHESIDDAAGGVGDAWVMVARARAGGSRRALAAAQGVVFRRFLPMARALAAGAVPADGPVDPGAAERAAENGLAKAVGWWRSADGAGFALFARITIAVELDRLSASRGEGSVAGVAARFAALMRDQPPEGAGPELPARLARAAVQVLPGVGGAGVSVLAGPGRRIPVGASDDVAATAERLQFTMGEGPSVPAHTSAGAVIATGAMIARRWPLLYRELTTKTPYRAVLSVPLRYRPTGVGALDLHLLQDDGEVTLSALPDIAAIADQIVTALAEPHASARQPGQAGSAGPAWLDSPSAQRRRRVWAAVGLLGVHLNMPVPDALDTLRAAAFGRGRFLDDLAEDLTTGRLPLTDLPD